MSVHVLLSLLNKLRKKDKMQDLLSILSYFRKEFRVLDSRPRGHVFEPHRNHCVVSLSKTHLSLLSTGSIQEDLSQHN